jgi:predicted nucleotidyltransferase
MDVLLAGVVGSTAYGLAGPDSDVDRLGIFAAPTIALHGLTSPKESYVTTGPDQTLHEAGKFCRLAIKGNPSVGELMWLEEYEVTTELGRELVAIRAAFLSAPAVRGAYLGYASDQLTRLIRRGDGSFSADIPAHRALKHARHMVRLVEQGEQLYTTGQLTVRVDNPERLRTAGRDIVADPEIGRGLIKEAEARMQALGSPLPDRADVATVERWLLKVRAHHYQEPPR